MKIIKSPAAELLLLMIGVYSWIFGNLTWAQQSNFGTFGFDMGIYDQGIWLLSRFDDPFVTIRGLNLFGHHVNLVTLLFVPFYWLGAGPHFLYLAETLMARYGCDTYLAYNKRCAMRSGIWRSRYGEMGNR